MAPTIDQALQEGITAHRAGKLKEAELLYRSILKTHPRHADANHNLGVLAVGIGKTDLSLVHFKVALEAAPKRVQFWISYIEALITLGKFENARVVLKQGQQIGLQGDKIDELATKLDKKNIQPHKGLSDDQALQELLALYNQGKLEEALSMGLSLSSRLPNHPMVFNLLGAIYSGLGKYEEAISFQNKAVELAPRNVETRLNLGAIFISAKRYSEAVVALQYAINLKPEFSEAYNNLGTALNELSNFEEAMSKLKIGLVLKPNLPDLYGNIGNSFDNVGEVKKAFENYSRCLLINADNVNALDYLSILILQMNIEDAATVRIIQKSKKILGAKIGLVYQTAILINDFIKGELGRAARRILPLETELKGMKYGKLDFVNRRLCSVYFRMIKKLLEHYEIQNSVTSCNEIFHIGESHCLSYAHKSIEIQGVPYCIRPKLILGAKAWHLAEEKNNRYKSFFSNHLKSLPQKSKILLSFGEIDCREDEGILTFSKKNSKKISEVVENTVDGYVEFVAKQFQNSCQDIFFLGIPAPKISDFDENTPDCLSVRRIKVVREFNKVLEKKVLSHGFKFIDIYSFTSTAHGISNNKNHIDNRHLGPWSLKNIENLIQTMDKP